MVPEQGHDIYREPYTIPKVTPIILFHLIEMEQQTVKHQDHLAKAAYHSSDSVRSNIS